MARRPSCCADQDPGIPEEMGPSSHGSDLAAPSWRARRGAHATARNLAPDLAAPGQGPRYDRFAKKVRINFGSTSFDQTWYPLSLMTSLPGAGRKVVTSSRISVPQIACRLGHGGERHLVRARVGHLVDRVHDPRSVEPGRLLEEVGVRVLHLRVAHLLKVRSDLAMGSRTRFQRRMRERLIAGYLRGPARLCPPWRPLQRPNQLASRLMASNVAPPGT